MRFVRFEIPGPPKGKARHRTAQGHNYTPAITKNYENLVKLCFREQCKDEPFRGRVQAVIFAYFPIPKSASKKKQALMVNGNITPTIKPDVDNVAKVVLDSLNGIAYRDDAQVSSCMVAKYYSATPRVMVSLYVS